MAKASACIILGFTAFIVPPGWVAESNRLPPFAWPAEGKVIDEDDGRPCPARYEGIDILVPEGTEVRASLEGTVIYAGSKVPSLGNLILIRHDGGWITVYGHNKELFVNRGEEVQTGDVIARSGRTGFVVRSQLHFEIRKGQGAWNPARYLELLKPQPPELP
jgi:murein DD-endopeptidase MepM/ murein hydrolase activator NlpD